MLGEMGGAALIHSLLNSHLALPTSANFEFHIFP
jgi:hypothetical protein